MSNWPLQTTGVGIITPSFVDADVLDVELGSPAAAPGWSAWVQVTASMPITAEALTVRAEFNDDWSPRRYLIRIGVGAAGSEVVIATVPWFLITGYRGVNANAFVLPIRIARGQRVAMALNTGGGSVPTPVRAVMTAQPAHPLMPVGFASSTLVGVDEGTMLSTVSAFAGFRSEVITEVVAATATRIRALSLSQISVGGSGSVAWDILAGPAGAEVPVVLGTTVYTPFQLATIAQVIPVSPVNIPAGTRLSVRGRQGGGSSTVDLALHLFA